jgi:hypothetical protein
MVEIKYVYSYDLQLLIFIGHHRIELEKNYLRKISLERKFSVA